MPGERAGKTTSIPRGTPKALARLDRIVEHSGRGEDVGEPRGIEVEPAGYPRDAGAHHGGEDVVGSEAGGLEGTDLARVHARDDRAVAQIGAVAHAAAVLEET